LLVLTGDNLSTPAGLDLLVWALEPFAEAGVPGAFVFGSHDYFRATPGNPAGYLGSRGGGADGLWERGEADDGAAQPDLPWREMRDAFVAAGWHDLNNARAAIVAGGVPCRLVGLGDPHIRADHMPGPAEDGAAGDGGAGNGGGLALGVVHAPYARALGALAADGARLILAGHTHGGQLAVPGWGALVANCDLPVRQARGLSGWPGPRPDAPGGEGSVWLNVSAGLGTSPYTPVRFACRPEASLLTLVPAPEAAPGAAGSHGASGLG
jgi:predicted MPP superfamily phosphohydrolase